VLAVASGVTDVPPGRLGLSDLDLGLVRRSGDETPAAPTPWTDAFQDPERAEPHERRPDVRRVCAADLPHPLVDHVI
jgi:hypothetical protein